MKEKAVRLIEESDLLPELKPEFKELLRFSIGMELEIVEPGTLPLGSSKIGGRPDLPPGFAWPWLHEVVEYAGDETSHDHRPLLFVAQLNFADLAPFCKLFPEQGILFIWDDYHGHEDGWKVLYYDGEEDCLVRTKNPEEDDEEEIRTNVYDDDRINECRTHFKPHWMLPPSSYQKADPLFDYDKMGSATYEHQRFHVYEKLMDQLRSLSGASNVHRILGYADGWVVDDIHHREQREDGREEEWLLLFQVADDDQALMSWGDGGCLTYWLRVEDLKRKRFDRIVRWWEQGC